MIFSAFYAAMVLAPSCALAATEAAASVGGQRSSSRGALVFVSVLGFLSLAWLALHLARGGKCGGRLSWLDPRSLPLSRS